jgi:glycosyltransferase involved in cell wall biosynthesis
MVVIDLARKCDRSRFEPHVVCLRNRGSIADRLESHGIPVHNLNCTRLYKLPTLARLLRVLHEVRPQVLHSHNPSPHLFGATAAKLSGIPVIVHTRHGRNYPHKRRSVLVSRFASSLTDCIVAVSDASADVARRSERVSDSRIKVIRNGIDLDAFPPIERPSDWPLRRAIHVARLIPLKDQTTLLRATRLVVNRTPDFGLDIVGCGPEQESLLALRAELKLEENVRFLGFRDDVRKLLPDAGMFVLSSLSEGIAISILEAMAARLPIVATDVGGNRELVASGENGYLVPPRSPELMAEAMLQIHQDPELAMRMGQASRTIAEGEFNLDYVVRQYENLYLRLLQSKCPLTIGRPVSMAAD